MTEKPIAIRDGDHMTAPTRNTEEDFTYRDANYPEDCTTLRVAKGKVFEGRAYVRIQVTATDDGEAVSAVNLLDAGTAVVMALDILSAAAEVMHTDAGPFQRMTRADHMAADAAIRTRRGAAQ